MELTQEEMDRIGKDASEYAKIFNKEYRYIAYADYLRGAFKEHQLAHARYEFIKQGVVDEINKAVEVQKAYYNTLDVTSQKYIADRDEIIESLARANEALRIQIEKLESEHPRFDLIRDYRNKLTTKDNEIAKLKGELPDIYSGDLNTERIKTYRKVGEHFFGSESVIRDAFCKGADWYKSLLTTKK